MEEAMEITCTMRNWTSWAQDVEASATSNQSSLVSTGPELLLMEVPLLSPRAISPTRDARINNSRNSSENKPEPTAFHMSLADILLVENVEDGSRKSLDTSQRGVFKLRVTTQTNGFFLFEGLSRNSRDVLLAFLKANLPAHKMTDSDVRDDESCPSAASTSSATSLDVERFTAEKMEGSARREPWTSRFFRRLGKIAMGLSEACSTTCDTSCCRPAKVNPVGTRKKLSTEESVDDESSNMRISELGSGEKKLLNNRPRMSHIPSGLSMEVDSMSLHSESVKGDSSSVHGSNANYLRQKQKFREGMHQFTSELSVEPESVDEE